MPFPVRASCVPGSIPSSCLVSVPAPSQGAELGTLPQLALIKAPLRCPCLLSVLDRVFLDHACLSSHRAQWGGPGACGWHWQGSRSESQPHACGSFVAFLTVKRGGQGLFSCFSVWVARGMAGKLSLETGAVHMCI